MSAPDRRAVLPAPWLILGAFAAILLLRPFLPEWAVAPPEAWTLPFTNWINVATNFLRTEPLVLGVTFKDFTRFVADMVQIPLNLMEGVLFAGFKRSIGLPALPWIAVSGLATVFAWRVGGWRLALLTGTCLVYFAVFGKWKPAMQTLSSVLTAAPIAGGIGLVLGIAAARSPGFERILWPILNVMQSMPHFSYLIPVAVFIGVGHKAGTIATILFAMPPMARLALTGLRGVPQEVREAGMMAGCTAWQMLWKVEIPAARPSLLLGVNQVIMQCLAMVVIASFVGAKGFGHDLLFRLQSLRIGEALEIGVAIVFMAITLDRITQALSALEPEHERSGPFWKRRPASTAAIAVLAVSIPLAALFPVAEAYPRAYALTTAPFWDALVNYITLEYYDALAFIRDGLLINVLIPVRTAFLYLPWTSILALAVPGRLGHRRPEGRGCSGDFPCFRHFRRFLRAGSHHRIHGVLRRSRVRAHRFSARHLGKPLATPRPGSPLPLRHVPDVSVLHLSHPGHHAVPRRRCRRSYGNCHLCHHSRDPVHDLRTSQRSRRDCRGRYRVRLQRAPTPVEDSNASCIPADDAGREPDRSLRPVHGDYRGIHRHPRSRTGDLPGARLGGCGQGNRHRALRLLHGAVGRPPDQRLGREAKARSRTARVIPQAQPTPSLRGQAPTAENSLSGKSVTMASTPIAASSARARGVIHRVNPAGKPFGPNGFDKARLRRLVMAVQSLAAKNCKLLPPVGGDFLEQQCPWQVRRDFLHDREAFGRETGDDRPRKHHGPTLHERPSCCMRSRRPPSRWRLDLDIRPQPLCAQYMNRILQRGHRFAAKRLPEPHSRIDAGQRPNVVVRHRPCRVGRSIKRVVMQQNRNTFASELNVEFDAVHSQLARLSERSKGVLRSMAASATMSNQQYHDERSLPADNSGVSASGPDTSITDDPFRVVTARFYNTCPGSVESDSRRSHAAEGELFRSFELGNRTCIRARSGTPSLR